MKAIKNTEVAKKLKVDMGHGMVAYMIPICWNSNPVSSVKERKHTHKIGIPITSNGRDSE